MGSCFRQIHQNYYYYYNHYCDCKQNNNIYIVYVLQWWILFGVQCRVVENLIEM